MYQKIHKQKKMSFKEFKEYKKGKSLIMNEYIKESMAMVGCGASDTREIANICSGLSEIEWDTLDAMYSFGHYTTLTPVGSMTRASLISKFSDDDITCLSTYVNAYRNTIGA